MEAGLSKRMEKTLNELLPAAKAVAPLLECDRTTAIDLSNAQNEVLRSELLDFFKSTVDDSVTSQVFALHSEEEELRQALASFFNSYFRPIHPVKSKHIVLTAGVSDAVESLVHAVCDDGDSVIIPGPCWHGFDQVLRARVNVNTIFARPPSYEHWDNYLLPSLQAAYDFSPERSRIKAVILCNPHNPLSRCYPKEVLLELMEFCQERGLHLILDEIYALMDLKVDLRAPKFVSALSLTEALVPSGAIKIDPSRVHVVWSASKLFGMSGFRVGCFISQQNPQLTTAMSLLTTSHVNNVASAYLSGILTWWQLPTLLALNSERLTASYRLLAEALRSWKIDFVTPTHGVFLFAKLATKAKSANDEKQFFDRLALHGVFVAQGRFHKGVEGDYGWARIRFSVSTEVMKTALKKLEAFLG